MVGEAAVNDDPDANAGMILNVLGHQVRKSCISLK